jgi:hypothetical protein
MEPVWSLVMAPSLEPDTTPGFDSVLIPFDIAFFETVSPLEMERSVFDSAEARILSTAFEKAWAYVEFDPVLGILDAAERQSELARCLMAILKFGESDPTSLANSGIALLRRSQRSGVRA